MKYLIIALALAITGCTSSNDGELRQVKSDLRSTTYQLETCQSQLEVYRGGSSSTAETQEEPEQPAEPQYETVAAYHITTKLGSTVCYERNNAPGGQDSEDLACGMTFSECKDGYIYRCMTDVKYKVVEEQKLVE